MDIRGTTILSLEDRWTLSQDNYPQDIFNYDIRNMPSKLHEKSCIYIILLIYYYIHTYNSPVSWEPLI